MTLDSYGLPPVEVPDGDVAGVVLACQGTQYRIATQNGEMAAMCSGTFEYSCSSRSDLPVVGDWVRITCPTQSDFAIINGVYPRRTQLVRRTHTERDQLVGANIDTLVITFPINQPFDHIQIEFLMGIARYGGITPILVFTKLDLVETPDEILDGIRRDFPTVACVGVSATTQQGITELLEFVTERKVAAMVGPSGAGKSTLANALLGEKRMKVGDMGAKGFGRHTTTHRQMILLPNGGILVDTPGIRGLEVSAELAFVFHESFPDIQTIAEKCRFRNCRHAHEPDCAVLKAIEEGVLASERFAMFKQIRRRVETVSQPQTLKMHFERKAKAKAHAKDERRRRKS